MPILLCAELVMCRVCYVPSWLCVKFAMCRVVPQSFAVIPLSPLSRRAVVSFWYKETSEDIKKPQRKMYSYQKK